MKKILLSLFAFGAFLPAAAEISPLPEAQFNFIYETDAKPLINPRGAELVQCKDQLCMSAEPLGVYGSQRMTCGGGACTAIAYEFTPFAKLTVAFEDGKTRQSQVFLMPDALINQFNVYVGPDSLKIEAVDTPPQEALWKRPQAWGALSLILVLELLCAAAYIIYPFH